MRRPLDRPQPRAHGPAGLVYLSQPTELGTLYTKAELKAIHQVCWQRHIPLYIDGARCGYGLAAPENDVTLADLAQLSDVFYIGGTKVGALLGEAVVIPNLAIQRDFRYMIKRMGGMLAKGRLLGIQFEVLFEDGLYFQLGRRAVEQARRIRDAFQACGVELAFDSPTNQQFPVLTREQREALARKYSFNHWADLEDGRSVVRFCTSWPPRPRRWRSCAGIFTPSADRRRSRRAAGVPPLRNAIRRRVREAAPYIRSLFEICPLIRLALGQTPSPRGRLRTAARAAPTANLERFLFS